MDADHATLDLVVEEQDLSVGRHLRHRIEAEFGCLGEARADAALVISELFTNAMLHGELPVRVRADAFEGGVTLSIEDAGSRFGGPAPDSHGLVLVDALARDWGVRTTATGKVVWADIAARG